MARRNASQPAEANTENQEQDMTTTSTEQAPADQAQVPADQEAPTTEATESTEADHTPSEEEIQGWLDKVAKAAEEVAPQADPSTGLLTEEQLKPVVDAYLEIPGRQQKVRNAAKEALLDKMKWNLDPQNEGSNFITARAYVLMQDAITKTKAAKGGGAGKAPAAPVDPTEAFVANAASLILAVKMTQAHFVPEGVAEDWGSKVKELNDSEAVQEDIQKLVDWKASVDALEDDAEAPDMPEVQAHVLAAWKMASKAGKVKRTRSGSGSARVGVYAGPQRSVAKHIQEFAQANEAGVYPISVVSNFSSEEYGDDHPSSGALSAHLFPKSGKDRSGEGYEAATTSDNKKGLKVL